MSLKEAQRIYELYQQGAPVEECDLVATASPYPLLVKSYQMTAAACQKADAALLDGLAARGFRLDNGEPDNTGYQMKYLRRGGGYYFNVGASDLIVEGKINLLHHKDIDRVVANGLLMKDGSVAGRCHRRGYGLQEPAGCCTSFHGGHYRRPHWPSLGF